MLAADGIERRIEAGNLSFEFQSARILSSTFNEVFLPHCSNHV